MQSDNKDLLCPFDRRMINTLKQPHTFGGNTVLTINRSSSFSSYFRKGSTLILAFSLFAGLLAGLLLHREQDASIFSLMHVSAKQSASIVSGLLVLLLPFLLSAFFSSTCTAWLIIPLSFLKGVCFSFCQATICSSFVGAGWLLYFFFMFSDILTLPVLIFFWISCLNKTRHIMKLLSVCSLTVLFIALIGHHFITPYCISLFN